MPDVPMLYLEEWTHADAPHTYSVSGVDSMVVREESSSLGVNELADLQREYELSGWRAPTPDDELPPWPVVLIGVSQAPIERGQVERSYHQGHQGRPMVEIKVHDTELPTGDEWTALVDEFRSDLDSRLASLTDSDLRDVVMSYIEAEPDVFGVACERAFDQLTDDVVELLAGHTPQVWQAGRSGGWLVVGGLPGIETWGPDLLAAWVGIARASRQAVADVPRQMAWEVLANHQPALAGRVVTCTVTITFCDEDLADFAGDPHDPTTWNWREKLGLSPGSGITVRCLKGARRA